jgi:hypothetical protein
VEVAVGLGSLVLALVACKADYHPEGYLDPTVHGTETKLGGGVDAQGGDCRDCHGDDLESGEAVACSECHGAGWTTECTFCHGDPADGTGAPPRDIDGTDDPDALSFPAHRAHVDEGELHADLDCSTCHVKPESALAAGHVFDDDTPGRAEVALADGGRYDADTSTCHVSCHGDGTGAKGAVSVGDGPVSCESCHDAPPSSGQHVRHTLEGFTCAECHPDAGGADGRTITKVARHVDGSVDVKLPDGMDFTRSDGTCSGTCHGEVHSGRRW